MSTALTLYNSACTALAEAQTLLDVKDIADNALALKEYGRLAKERSLEIKAAELRIRSEQKLARCWRRLSAIKGVIPMRKYPLRRSQKLVSNQSSQCEPNKLASIPEPAIEARIARWRDKAERGTGRVTVNLLRDDSERVPTARSALKASAWANAAPERRRQFVAAVKFRAIVAAIGVKAFWGGLASQQMDEFNSLAIEWEKSQPEVAESAP